jgi:predicted nucleotidyltransferase
LNVAGFEELVPNAVPVSVAPEIAVPVAPVPLYVLLKLVA